MDISERIKTLRKEKRMTQAELAGRLGLTNRAVGAWELGKSRPRIDKLEELARILGTTPYYLLNGDGPERSEAEGTSATVPFRAEMGACMGDGERSDADRVVEVPAGVAGRHPGLFVVHGAGPCCNRRFPEDAALGIDPGARPRNGDAVLARDDAHGAFVHVIMRGAGGTVMLSADSWQDGWPDIVYGPDDPPVELLGTVVWWQAWEDAVR